MGRRTVRGLFRSARRELIDAVRAPRRIHAELVRLNRSEDRLLDDVRSIRADLSVLRADLRALRDEMRTQRRYHEIARFAYIRPVMDDIFDVMSRRQLDFTETLSHIIDRRLSYARFGDGELRLMVRPDHDVRFQRGSAALRDALRRVFTLDGYDSDRLLVGFPYPHQTNLHWCAVWMDVWPSVRSLLPERGVMGNSHVTRPIFFEMHGVDGVKLWRRVWDGKRVCVVTGQASRCVYPDELFDNARSLTTLESVASDAFADIPRLVSRIAGHDAELFLIALGPAGTVLAGELSLMDRWAIDVGHLSNSWEFVFGGSPTPESLPVRR